MLAKLIQHALPLTQPGSARHILVVLPELTSSPDESPGFEFAGRHALADLLARRKMAWREMGETPLSASLEGGALCVWITVNPTQSAFEQQTRLRKAVRLLLEEKPAEIHLAVYGEGRETRDVAEWAVYAALVNGAELPTRKTGRKSESGKSLARIVLHGCKTPDGFSVARARAEGNLLTRSLTMLPPNELTPAIYRAKIRELAGREGWKYREFDVKALRKMGAGAFVAVAQGSDPEDAAIVHLTRRAGSSGKTAKTAKTTKTAKTAKNVALVGKGICFDTGGHNLKPAKYMHGMHEDMNGSAVALGILLAATRLGLPVDIDCWLAIAQNHISPHAYKQNDVVTALHGTTIEIIHTDAEGRMVLADTLTLAARQKPDLMIDFATLTGTMHTALGCRYSGIFANREELLEKASSAGKSSGERIWPFPMDADYDDELESRIADVKQCALEGDADHILAARFLGRFAGDGPWIHMDLSASSCKGGLGAVGSDVTGFGVGWGLAMLENVE
jgi:leucyl aminopeptidase